MLEWLIVGGGVHGTSISRALVEEGGVSPDRVAVLDSHREPLWRWDECTAATGMEFLRSPGVHHLAAGPMDLYRFARRFPEGRETWFRGPTGRPALSLFRAHAREEVRRLGLERLHLRGRAERLTVRRDGSLQVESPRGTLAARRVVLALGASEQPLWRPWAAALRAAGARIHHVFEPGFRLGALEPWQHAVVVGGGVSAVQTALALARKQPGCVTILARHKLRVHPYDTDPCWMGPKCLQDQWEPAGPVRRREILRQVRHRGSVPPDVEKDLRRREARGEIAAVQGEVAAARRDSEAWMALERLERGTLGADLVVLATGFDPCRPGGAWLDTAIAALGLPCAPCGYPIPDRGLRWRPGLWVTGPLAELELGPVSRNILGARLATRRLLAACS
jgi:cation diffusion facilitator CzcD-associated flavoprotein CzcO